MSDDTTTRPLAEVLRAYLDAENGVREARRALPHEFKTWPETSMASYLRGYDDARAELAADIEENGTLKRRVQQLEAQLEREQEFAQHSVRRASQLQKQCAVLKQANDNLARESIGQSAQAIGVVGNVRYSVASTIHHDRLPVNSISDTREEMEQYMARCVPGTLRVVAIVDPDEIVPLSQREPVFSVDADVTMSINGPTVSLKKGTFLYPGIAQPAQQRKYERDIETAVAVLGGEPNA